MWHAKNPAGPWSETVTVKAVDLWEDPCPLWDEDGQAYLVHSRLRAGPLILHKMSADGTKLLDEGKEIYRGPNAEGPKFYKRGGYYYISLPEGGFKVGWQTVLRSKNVYGPYEKRVVFNGVGEHQGGMVDMGDGTGWFIGFKEDGWQRGGEGILEPVKWGEDGWPVFGNEKNPVGSWTMPVVAGGGGAAGPPEVSDDFRERVLPPVWQWNHNPVASGMVVDGAGGVFAVTVVAGGDAGACAQHADAEVVG